MRALRYRGFVAAILLLLSVGSSSSAESPQFTSRAPDPLSIERYGAAYRYPQSGWIVLHIEGDPYERGYQHGRLLAAEIMEIVRAAAVNQSPKAPEDGWAHTRMLVDALFLRRYDEEYLVEMKGIADGASAAGATFDGRPVDFLDIVTVNAWTEVEFLEAALRATPKGIEQIRARDMLPTRAPASPPERCSSFIANGPATANGKIVFGHITMWSLQPARHFNVWLDIKPAKGHRIVMQSFPGGIQSSMDYYMNDNGMLVSETTIGQTRFNAEGQTESSRIRRALQYGSSIDEIVEILRTGNNGLYSNEWLIGDTKTNEIAMFELGTAKSRLWRSSRDEWFGDTPGFYWGCNNSKDLAVRLETIASLSDRPENVVFRPSDRDLMWQRLYAEHAGKIDGEFGFEAFTTSPLAAAHSLDAKFTTTSLAGELKTYAIFGPPLGRTWEPTEYERRRYGDEIKPLISNGWTLLDSKRPAAGRNERQQEPAVDLASASVRGVVSRAPSAAALAPHQTTTGPLWHGTLLPNREADVWLAAAWAEYERVASRDRLYRTPRELQHRFEAASDRNNLALFPYRSQFMLAAQSIPEVSLTALKSSNRANRWYDLASGKGVWLLSELRSVLGDDKFLKLMNAYSDAFAGKPADAEAFRNRAESIAGESLRQGVRNLFQCIADGTELPSLELLRAERANEGQNWHVKGQVRLDKPAYPIRVELLVETEGEPITQVVSLDQATTSFDISSTAKPKRLVVDPRNQRLRRQGAVFSLQSFERELDQAMIVFGTGSESASMKESAELLQRRIATQWSNYSVPIKADRDLTEQEIRTHHLLVVGRPGMNSIADRFRRELPVRFGDLSFEIAGRAYAHPGSAVVVAISNPFDSRFSVVLFAGLSAESNRKISQVTPPAAEIMLWPANGNQQSLVLPARELIAEFE